jgi:hypothetical protein
MKKCIACNKELKLNNFSGDKSRKDGFHSKCKVCVRQYAKDLRIKNGWVKKQKKDSICKKEYFREYRKNKMITDPIFKIKCNTRSLLYNAFNRACKGKYNKSLSTENMLCCSMDFFIKYIESKFLKGMTFENYGTWHLDHILPISNCNNLEYIIKYNHYTNFQPLWAKDNIIKSNK